MRTAQITRKTNETDIQLSLNLDGRGESSIESGVGFLDHMLTLLSRHGRMDLELTCRGDTYVDDHHTVEDIGIALGQAFAQALGEKRGVKRYASLCLPMDEALILCAVDLSGRGGYYEDLDIPTRRSALSTPSWCTSSWRPSPSTPRSPSISGSWPAATPTTSWRGPSRPWAASSGRRSPSRSSLKTKFPLPKGCCKNAPRGGP